MKPINFFSNNNYTLSQNKQDALICSIMLLIIIALEAPTLIQLYTPTTATNNNDVSTIESMRQTITTIQESCVQLKEQIALLENLNSTWCTIYAQLTQIIGTARNQLTIQHLHMDEHTLKITGIIDRQNGAKLSTLITILPTYKNLGFTTTPVDKSSYYNFTITTREAVDGLQEPTYAKQNTLALTDNVHGKNKATPLT